MTSATTEPDWLHGHPHEPNPTPPSPTPDLQLELPGGAARRLTVAHLARLPHTELPDCFIVSTGHGVSGPFRFGGVTLRDLLLAHGPPEALWGAVDVISGDGFGNRVEAHELAPTERPILLAHAIDGRPLTREEGLVRLIAPDETDDALRQVKWVARLRIHLPGEGQPPT